MRTDAWVCRMPRGFRVDLINLEVNFLRVGIMGPYPPPRGGVSVHIKRLEEELHNHGVTVQIIDTNMRDNSCGWIKRRLNHLKWVLKVLICTRTDIIHIHGGSLEKRALVIFIARLYKIKTVVSFHSLRDEFAQMNFWQRCLLSYVVNHTDHIIAAGDNERDKLVKWFHCEKRLCVITAYIPPKRVETRLPAQLAEFLRNHKFIISANASNMDFYKGQDIYGLDMLVELCGRLSFQMDVGFVYCLTRLTNKDYFEKIRARIKELKIENLFFIVLDSIEFWPVLEKSHIFIRPTCTDSYGVSVAEALTIGIPSIASDACNRPEGTLLFQSRDSEDLYNKVCDIIRNYEQYRASIKHLKIENCAQDILRIYLELVGKL